MPVETVGAADLFPLVGEWWPSSEDLIECLRRPNDDVLTEVPVCTGEEARSFAGVWPLTWPDSGYGLFFFETVCFLEFGLVWEELRFPFADCPASWVEEFLKLASFRIQVENGRRRTGRAALSAMVVSWRP